MGSGPSAELLSVQERMQDEAAQASIGCVTPPSWLNWCFLRWGVCRQAPSSILGPTPSRMGPSWDMHTPRSSKDLLRVVVPSAW